jgi:hypothetical protein
MEKKEQDVAEKEIKEQSLVHDFNNENLKTAFNPKIVAILIGVVFIGVLSGFFVARNYGGNLAGSSKQGGIFNGSFVPKGTVVGSNDTSTFKDTVQGILKEGGVDGEGAFHLERPGGVSQNVYLTSSIVDLSKFINKKIKVWGQTQKAQSAGWLMDVGKVEVL